MSATERLDQIEARATAPHSMAYGLTHYATDVPALIAALRAVLAARDEWAREPDARMDKGWAVAVIDRAITSALGVQS